MIETRTAGQQPDVEVHTIPARNAQEALRLAFRRHPAATRAVVIDRRRTGRRGPQEPVPDWWAGYSRGRAERVQAEVPGVDIVAALRAIVTPRMLASRASFVGDPPYASGRNRNGREPIPR